MNVAQGDLIRLVEAQAASLAADGRRYDSHRSTAKRLGSSRLAPSGLHGGIRGR